MMLYFKYTCIYLLLLFGIFGYDVKDFEGPVNGLANDLDKFANDNLGVEFFQKHLRETTTTKEKHDVLAILREIHENLGDRARLASKALTPIIETIKEDYKQGISEDRPIQSCCVYDESKTEYTSLFKTKVNFKDICEYASVDHSFCPSQLRTEKKATTNIHVLNKVKMLNKMKFAYENNESKGRSRHLYFGSTEGYFLAYPAENTGREKCSCASFDPRLRPWYHNIVNPKDGKEVVIAIDFSTAMNEKKLPFAKKIAQLLFRMIDTKDMVSLRILTNNRLTAPSEDCLKKLTEAHPSVFTFFTSFIENTKPGGLLRYNNIFLDSFRLFGDTNKEKLFILITSGNFDEEESEIYKDYNKALQEASCVKVNIIFVEGEIKLASNILALHRDLLKKSCDTCNTCSKKNELIQVGLKDKEADLRQKVTKIYDSFMNDLGEPEISFTMPYEDFYGLGTMVDACTRVVSDSNVLHGVLCISFLSNELFGITAQFEKNEDTYPFLIDTSGATYIHPYYVDPVLHDNANRIEITYFEPSSHFKQVFESMKSGKSGNLSFVVNSSVPHGVFGAKFQSKHFTYYWEKVEKSSFSVGVAISDTFQNDLKLENPTTVGNESYHRLDLQTVDQKNRFCSQDGTVATKETSVLEIANDAFEKPSIYAENETISSVSEMLAYFEADPDKSPESLFQSSTIRASIREGVMATNPLNKYWTDDVSKETVIIRWRYIGLNNGVFRIYPGRMLKGFDARKQQWFHLAQTFPNRTVYASPYKDTKNKKIMLTLSKQVTKQLEGVEQSYGVMGMDFEMTYFQSLIEQHVTLCSGAVINGNCSIVNNDGFLVYHKDLLNADVVSRTNLHLVEKEPMISKHLIQQNIMTKSSCTEYNNQSPRIIWFYSLEGVTTAIQGETPCFTYWLVPIGRTNLFLLMTQYKSTCSTTTSVQCRCSQPSGTEELLGRCEKNVDHRQSCDCPCFDEKACLSALTETERALICRSRVHGFHVDEIPSDGVGGVSALKDCFPVNCTSYETSRDCERYGCRWESPQCLGAHVEDVSDDDSNSTVTIVIVCCVVGAIMLVLLLFVCHYRQKRRHQATSSNTTSSQSVPRDVILQNKGFNKRNGGKPDEKRYTPNYNVDVYEA